MIIVDGSGLDNTQKHVIECMCNAAEFEFQEIKIIPEEGDLDIPEQEEIVTGPEHGSEDDDNTNAAPLQNQIAPVLELKASPPDDIPTLKKASELKEQLDLRKGYLTRWPAFIAELKQKAITRGLLLPGEEIEDDLS